MRSFGGQAFFRMDLQRLDDLSRKYSSMSAAVANGRKTPDIDPEYFSDLENELPLLIWDKDLPINYRMTAGLLWLEMYVGLRRSELLTLTTESHVVKKTIQGKTADYLYYGVPKLSHGGRIERYAECYMLPGAVTAFGTLCELRQLVPGHEKTNALYVLNTKGKGKVNEGTFKYYYERLFLHELRKLSSTSWNEINVRHISGEDYSIPNLTQYRVHLCSFLYRQGVRLHIIELGMSHLTSSMIAYYYRVEDKTFTKYNSRLDNLIRTKINNDFDMVDHDEKGDVLLREFNLSLSRFRVYKETLSQMITKGYDYEIDRYTKLCRSVISTELRPALSHLDRLVAKEGRDGVLALFPNLRRILPDLNHILSEIAEWEKSQKKS